MSVLSQAFRDLPASHIPKFVVMDLMYRDADNYKTCEQYAFPNDSALTMAQLSVWQETYMPTEEILALTYGLPNLAPLDNVTDIGSDADHCFMELTEFNVTDAPSHHTNVDSTPFSEIYQNALRANTPEGFTDGAVREQKVLLSRITSDLTELLNHYNDVNVDELKQTLSAITKPIADALSLKLVSNTAQVVQSGETLLPSYMDVELMNTIIYSALTYTKGRNELNDQFGEQRLANFHAAFLTYSATQQS